MRETIKRIVSPKDWLLTSTMMLFINVADPTTEKTGFGYKTKREKGLMSNIIHDVKLLMVYSMLLPYSVLS